MGGDRVDREKMGCIEGVQMTAATNAREHVAEAKAIPVLTTWLGCGDLMLDVKITSPDLALAPKLAAGVLEPLVRQVFK